MNPFAGAVICLVLGGCTGGSMVQALASVEPAEIERFSTPPGMTPRRGEPGAPSLLSWSQYSSYVRKFEHPRLEMAALVMKDGPELKSAQISPYLDSRLKPSDISHASGPESGLLLRAKAPAKIVKVDVVLKDGKTQREAYGGGGKAVVHFKSPVLPGSSGRMKVTLQQPTFSSANVVIVSPGRTGSDPRFRLTKVSVKGGRTWALFEGKLDAKDCPTQLLAKSGFGRSLPLRVEGISARGVSFSMISSDFKKAWIVVMPELKLETLDLPLAPGKLQPVTPLSRDAEPSPLVRVVHEDPNKVAG